MGLEFFYWPDEALTSILYWTYVSPSPENRCVSSVFVKFARIFISSCGIILILFSRALYLVVQADGIVGEGVLIVPTLGDGAVIQLYKIGGSGVSTLGGAVSSTIRDADICTTHRGAQGLFRRA